MALLYDATLQPSKNDLVEAWLPSRPWALPGPTSSRVSYRLDDPDGEVGIEGFLLSDAGGNTVHLLLTYRARPLEGAEEHLLGTAEHSVLGTRWVYDGCGDPVCAAALASTIRTGGTQAEVLIDVGQGLERRDPQVRLQGSGQSQTALPPIGALRVSENGDTATISCDVGDVVVVRRIGSDPRCDQTLTATWGGNAGGVPIAGLRLR